MPIEIRELVIKAQVANEQAGSSAKGTGSSENGGAGQEQLINICVEKVLEILKEKAER